MKVFVTGGTGLIGYHVVEQLLAHQHQVVCLHRPASDVSRLQALNVTLVTGDLTDKTSLIAAMKGCDAVINVAGNYSFWEKDNSVFYRTNVEGTRHVMEAALENGVSKAIHISAVGIWGKVSQSPFNEDTPPANERFGIYFDSKFAGDQQAWDLAQRGLPLVIVYPCSVIGPNDQSAGGAYVQNLMREKLPAIVFPDAVLPYVDVDDVASAIVLALEKPNNIGEKYIVGKHHLTLKDYGELICRTAGSTPPKKIMKPGVAIGLARLFTWLARFTGRPPLWGMTLDQMLFLRELSKGLRVDATKVERELGLHYTPLETTIAKAVQSYLKNK